MARKTTKENPNDKNTIAKISINSENPDYLLVNGNKIYINEELRQLILSQHSSEPSDSAISQFAAISKLPGLAFSVGLPDFHAGYSLPIGSVAAIDLQDDNACVSPDGVGFDINCGVRCLRSNLSFKDFPVNIREKLGELLVEEIPFTSKEEKKNLNKISLSELDIILDKGMKSLLESGIVKQEDMECTESRGSLPGNSKLIGQSSKARGINQIGTLGEGNHYLEFQVVEKIFDQEIANKLGISLDQVLVSIHTGSRGLGHGCCTDILKEIKTTGRNRSEVRAAYKKISDDQNLTKEEKLVEYDKLKKELVIKAKSNTKITNTLMHIPYNSEIGQKYISVMFSASNFAWANRSYITDRTRKCLNKLFPDASLDVIYDVCHNIAKIEKDSKGNELLVHRKGASRVLPPYHPDLPEKYKEIGQPVLVGGSMGTHSYLIVGSKECENTCYSTCHGAGRQVSRSDSRKQFNYEDIIKDLAQRDIVFKSGSKEGMIEECSNCYKDVNTVVNHSEKMDITKTVCRVKPILVIKG